jgi:predicted phosphodiesterase
MKVNFLVIGDIHGKPIWKNIIEESTKETDIHKIIFLGDYVDSSLSIDEELQNLRSIISFKNEYQDFVELLLGNHDIQYYLPSSMLGRVKCTGFKESKSEYDSLHKLFKSYQKLFKLSYQYKTYLFTHAGIHKGWYNMKFKKYHLEHETISDALNREFKNLTNCLFDCSYIRGGSEYEGGPFWSHKTIEIYFYLKPIVQSEFLIDSNLFIFYLVMDMLEANLNLVTMHLPVDERIKIEEELEESNVRTVKKRSQKLF